MANEKLFNIEAQLNINVSNVNLVEGGPRKPSMRKPPLPIKPSIRIQGPSVRVHESQNKEEVVRDDLMNPYWIEQDKHIGSGPQRFLKAQEITFWHKMIDKYLKPLDKDKEKEKRDSQGLKELRNTWVFSFLLANALWIAAFIMVNQNSDILSFT